jgi:hypothetical protein
MKKKTRPKKAKKPTAVDEKRLEQWRKEKEEREQDRKAHLDFIEEMTAKVKGFYNRDRGTHLDAPELMAALLEAFDIDDFKGESLISTDQLYVKWTLDHYVGRKAKKIIETAETVYGKLFEEGYFEGQKSLNPSGDNYAYVIPHKTKKLFVLQSQNCNFIFILTREYEHVRLHVRRFWDTFDPENEDLQWEVNYYNKEGKLEEFARLGIGWWHERYSDHCGSNRGSAEEPKHDAYVRQPDLDFFRFVDYEVQYGDFRDTGYVLSTDRFDHAEIAPRVEGVSYSFHNLGHAMFLLNIIDGTLSGKFD